MNAYPKVWLLLAVLLLPMVNAASPRVVIYKNDACNHCELYLKEFFVLMEKNGISADQIRMSDYINDPQKRQEVAQLQQKFGVPLDMQGHMIALLDGQYVLEGHVPLEAVQGFLNEPKPGRPLVVYQDSMEAGITSYETLSQGQRQVYSRWGQPVAAPGQDYAKYAIPALLIAATGGLMFLGLKK
ncbi:hypothetical protein HY994_00570 [Candidatus Micrarchaeota archaeon]|nr:hypothetical protein [Candidatus Micrarchaeota archaeon]